jgi:hypothetical protein
MEHLDHNVTSENADFVSISLHEYLVDEGELRAILDYCIVVLH